MRIARLPLLCVLLALPACAGVIYDNGPINGTNTAYSINDGFTVTNSFTLTNASSVTGANIGLWIDSGATLLTVDWAITSDPFGGTTFGSGTAGLTYDYWGSPSFLYNTYSAGFTLSPVILAPGTYWLQLANATGTSGANIYWDENSGPSTAWQTSGWGTYPIGSEAFQILGNTSEDSVPEPGSLALFGSGVLILAGLFRRRVR
jgi:hypothetical protein